MKRAGALPAVERAICQWLAASPRRGAVIAALGQPLTARQLALRLGVNPDLAAYCFWELSLRRLTRCLNPGAAANRLHWLTRLGRACRDELRRRSGLPPRKAVLPRIDWVLYGELLYRHRAAVLRAMNGPMRPCDIRRRAIKRQMGLRMSANNARDVMRFLVGRGVAMPVEVPGRSHTHYSLTATGMVMRDLLLSATPSG